MDPHAKAEIETLIEAIQEIRSMRTDLNVPPAAKLKAYVLKSEPGEFLLRGYQASLSRLARVEELVDATPPAGVSADIHVANDRLVIPLGDAIDVDAERSRISKALVAAEKERDGLAARLANPNFTERAKPEAVEKARADHEAKSAEAERLRAALERLG